MASDETIYAWRKRFGELEPVEVKRLRQLESDEEEPVFRKLVAERDLVWSLIPWRFATSGTGARSASRRLVSATARRQQVAYVRERGVSIRRACRLLSVARSTLRYESVLAKRDAPVIGAMRELAEQYPRISTHPRLPRAARARDEC